MIRRPPRSTRVRSSAASDVYKRQDHRLRGRLDPQQRRHDDGLGTAVHDSTADTAHQGESGALRNPRLQRRDPDHQRLARSRPGELTPRTFSRLRSTAMARNRAAHPTNPARRRFAAVVLGVVGIAGLGIASAAQITVGSSTLGVGATIVSTCQGTGTITTSFPTAWNTTVTPAAYRVTAVGLSGVNAACVGKAYLADACGVHTGE